MTATRIFLGIGAQKAGTTTLTAYLSAHPQVHVPAIKEMHFFDMLDDDKTLHKRLTDDIRRRYRRLEMALKKGQDMDDIMAEIRSITDRFAVGNDPGRYIEMLTGGAGAARICGEFTPAYAAMSATQWARIPRMLDRPRILFILRNPADRFLSQAAHQGTPLARLQDAPETPLALLDRPGFVARSRYQDTLRVLDDLFAPEDVFIGFFEDMLGPQAPAFHDRMCRFLGVDPSEGPQVLPGKPMGQRGGQDAARGELVRHFADTLRIVKDRMGTVPDSWEQDLARF